MCNKQRWLYLDLEQTVIDSWDNRLLIRPGAIVGAIKNIAPTHIGIFYFAIVNNRNREDYFQNIDSIIDRLAGRPADCVVTVNELVDLANE